MNQFFQLTKNNTNTRTEVVAGFTTFLSMVYIIVVNPGILSAAGVPFDQVFMATIISAIVGTLIMGLLANYPIAIAPGMGLNVYFTTTVAKYGFGYEVIFGAVFLAGLLFIVLSLTSFREKLIEAIPDSLKYGISSGIGLFITFVGLEMGGILAPSEEGLIGDLSTSTATLTLIGLGITLVLLARNVKGALFIGMILTALVAYFFTGDLTFKEGTSFVDLPPMPVFFDMNLGLVLTNIVTEGLYIVIFAFLLVTIFDTTGTIIGVAEQAGYMKDGKLPNAKPALLADAVATSVGATFGTSPSTAYIESTTGVAAGGRTGLTSVVVASLFFVSMFFSGIIQAIANVPSITAPVLIIVGCFMIENLSRIDWKTFDESFPAFAILLAMPLTSSIAEGIAIGFITYPLLKLVSGKGKEVHWLLYLFAVIFAVYLIFL
ncbi:guanine permease [Pontibacillus halophilus JSM 076056 = DSM 19796]|uniref:Guanine permease n=1 Tax=Pontibacillus halophilus JSM 076056 = DSM 19796 TaxID=1385510 RepID=A0A0A5GIZ2_9BACI|nr:NCS2 family permease [Pontibacillus halophilus]KGX93226.1 guanine permease [Pontibacillus halophilus JSM 076056 = DSM 19796]